MRNGLLNLPLARPGQARPGVCSAFPRAASGKPKKKKDIKNKNIKKTGAKKGKGGREGKAIQRGWSGKTERQFCSCCNFR